MAKKKASPPTVIRRSSGEKKPVSKELEAFAGGDDDAIWRRKRRPRLSDPRPVVLVPGVANRDARAVYQAHAARIGKAAEAGEQEALETALRDAYRLRVWRGNAVVGWHVFILDVLALDLPAADRAVAGLEAANEEEVAIWMRTEAGALEARSGAAVTFLDGRLRIDIPIESAPAALSAIGKRASPLAREAEEAETSVVDRPKGLPRISKLIERDMKGPDG